MTYFDDVAQYNQERWEELAAKGLEYTRPVLDLDAEVVQPGCAAAVAVVLEPQQRHVDVAVAQHHRRVVRIAGDLDQAEGVLQECPGRGGVFGRDPNVSYLWHASPLEVVRPSLRRSAPIHRPIGGARAGHDGTFGLCRCQTKLRIGNCSELRG